MEKLNLENIKEFDVTDRGLEEVFESMGLKKSEIDKFPIDGAVLNLGSGLYQKFEQDLAKARSDLKLVSVDPTLGIDPEKLTGNEWYIEKMTDSTAAYKHRTVPKLSWIKDYTVARPGAFQARRQEKIENVKSGSVAALAPNLPFKPESFDVIIDCVASMRYLEDKELRKDNLGAICGLLKPGGSAYITGVNENELTGLDEDYRVESLKRFRGLDGSVFSDVKISREKEAQSRIGENRPGLKPPG